MLLNDLSQTAFEATFFKKLTFLKDSFTCLFSPYWASGLDIALDFQRKEENKGVGALLLSLDR